MNLANPNDDPYIKVVNALASAIETLDTYFEKPEQVTFNRSEISTGADYWFILTPGSFSDARLDNRDDIVAWVTQCELAVRFAEYNSRTEKFLQCRGDIRKLLKTPYILPNIKIKPPVIINGGELRQDVPGLNPNWIVQPLTITVSQYVNNI